MRCSHDLHAAQVQAGQIVSVGHFVGYSTGKKGYRVVIASGQVVECGAAVFVEHGTSRSSAEQQAFKTDSVKIDLDRPQRC